ncbi:MAG: hypothetical protein MUF54_18810, partial [Polyangiaceae bacterium]|nr:hypothetical protein [Polyangiaceae bacterium]
MTITTWLCSTRIGVALGLVVSCTGPTNPVKPPPSSPEKPAAVAGASHWAYLPIEPARLRARQELGDAVLLFAGDKGERWLVDARRGSARAAAHLADENLVGIARPEPGLFVFVGDKGTLYRTSSPLGPFDDVLRVEPSPQQVVAAGPFVLALQWDGVLRRSEDGGRSFERANLAAERPFELALAPDGRVMLASYPEQLWLSSDAG